ncbi:lytic murein transglycosylase [Altererythrobacter sp. H2]|uniref:lytic murein transglycosylase n=1 Tax=Altererythrobacter sp. H2 TaxID=3108391 RepID=UPI002B4BCFA4|nr:lytic murein transglycosylase [Altererythrobacter sp. H2]WRK94304.1 lytic murein transglycosylase [Altererythrobacter sp. H2]
MLARRLILASALFALSAPMSAPVPAAAQDMDFDAYLQVLMARARAEGVSQSTISRMTEDLSPNMRVIELDRSQPGTPTRTGFPAVAPYLDRHVTSQRINAGRNVLDGSSGTLASIERRYGVPGSVLVAIWGKESNYGSYKGDFDLSRSLATLAWEGRRRDLFAREWVDLLKVADKGYPRSNLVGSWAGAFGNPQFLPSVYLRLAVDGDGDGRADIFNNRADTLASIANYFRDAGWRTGQPWGVRTTVPTNFDWNGVQQKLVAPTCSRVHERHSRWLSVREWRARGVQPQAAIGDDVMATLFQPDGPATPAWLLTANYRVILEYNCSNYYALSVGLLADEIAK